MVRKEKGGKEFLGAWGYRSKFVDIILENLHVMTTIGRKQKIWPGCGLRRNGGDGRNWGRKGRGTNV